MKKILLAVAMAVISVGAAAHYSARVHYHNDDGTVTFSDRFEPSTESTFDRDAQGRRVRVETTTVCTETRVDRQSNHLRCLEQDTSVKRIPEGGSLVHQQQPPALRPMVEPLVYRDIQRDGNGRRVIISTIYTCTDARLNPEKSGSVCLKWDLRVERDYVRRDPRAQSLDINGDGRTEAWERLLFNNFRDVLDN